MDPNNPQAMFLYYIRPHRLVTSQQIAHWLKEILGGAGVDTSVFKVHSVGGASSMAASEKGILRTVDRSTNSTFRRFYYQPTHQSNYA